MHMAQREIGEVEITIEQLDAVSGGRASLHPDARGAFINGMIHGFCDIGGGETSFGPTGLDFNKGGQTITIHI